ncbi:MAG TPA: glycosyltransferase [Dehalococcoidia bacterium]|nr:glycosyltransferase [Dehalococcoidia bacterium]
MAADRLPRISVIIPVKNMAGKIEACLKAVFAQSLPPYEVIVVDGRSTDGTAERAQKFPVKVFEQDYGAAGAARQIGVEHAEGEYLAFTDGDCIPGRDWLKNLLAGFGEGIVGVGGGIQNIGKGLWTKSINLAFATLLGSGRSVQGGAAFSDRFVRSISGCNSMYRKEDILRAGGFDPNLSGADETELNSRLLKSGKLRYVGDAAVLHDHSRGLKEFARNMCRYGGWRKECGVWDWPVLPPLLAPLLLLTMLASRWILPAIIGFYLVIVGLHGLYFAIKERDLRYLFTVPSVYIIEHLCYTAGFWKEVFRPRKMPQATGEKPQ